MFLIFLAIYFYFANDESFRDKVEAKVEEFTGTSRGNISDSLTEELRFLEFKRVSETGIEHLYYYDLETSPEKRLLIVKGDKDSNLFVDGDLEPYFVEETEYSKTHALLIKSGENPPKVVIQTSNLPKAYLGKQKHVI